MFLREKLTIPEKRVKKSTGLFTEEEFTIPGFEFHEQNPYPSGGLNLNITITEQDLEKNTLVLFAVSPDLAAVPQQKRSVKDLEQSAKINQYSKVFAALLKPIFQ
jgi:hypothetical protein